MFLFSPFCLFKITSGLICVYLFVTSLLREPRGIVYHKMSSSIPCYFYDHGDSRHTYHTTNMPLSSDRVRPSVGKELFPVSLVAQKNASWEVGKSFLSFSFSIVIHCCIQNVREGGGGGGGWG